MTNATELLSGLLGQQIGLSSCSHVINQEALKRTNYVPVCKRSVCYVVNIVLFNQSGQVLLVQEAKESCKGQWYLPAGRMESNETLDEAAVREVKEEAGYIIEPLSLCMVEIDPFSLWLRFTYVAKIVGGSLKTLEQGDHESLQAAWFDKNQISSVSFPRRSNDMIKSIYIAHEYYNHYKIDSYTTLSRAEIMTQRQVNLHTVSLLPHKHMYFSYLVLDDTGSHCLLYNMGSEHRIPSVVVLPDCYMSRDYIFNHLIDTVLLPALINDKREFTWLQHSTLTVEHNGKNSSQEKLEDGFHMLFVLMISKKSTTDFNPISLKLAPSVEWVPLDSKIPAIAKFQKDLTHNLQFTKID